MLDKTVMTLWSRIDRGEQIEVRFIQPVIATFLACARIARPQMHVNFRPDKPGLDEYAERSGLSDALAGNFAALGSPRGGNQGVTWSALTTLWHHAEIEACNQTINDLLFAQLSGMPAGAMNSLARVVGELHDNIASHASGRGFSAAQFYPANHGHPPRLELSVADAGQGFLRNVKRVHPTIRDHADAIRWCLKKGNTAALQNDSPTPSTDWNDPYAETEGVSGQRDHHMGWGLWLLSELVRSTHGELWIWSGDASYTISHDGSEVISPAYLPWSGVVINLTFFPDSISARTAADSAKIQALAEELGL